MILGQDRWASADGEPIAILRDAARHFTESTGGRKPNKIVMHRETVLVTVEWFKRAIRRANKFLQKPLLSGNYQKRQRQRRTGKAQRAHEKRRWYLRMLPEYREHLEHWQRMAGTEDETVTLDMNLKQEGGGDE